MDCACLLGISIGLVIVHFIAQCRINSLLNKKDKKREIDILTIYYIIVIVMMIVFRK